MAQYDEFGLPIKNRVDEFGLPIKTPTEVIRETDPSDKEKKKKFQWIPKPKKTDLLVKSYMDVGKRLDYLGAISKEHGKSPLKAVPSLIKGVATDVKSIFEVPAYVISLVALKGWFEPIIKIATAKKKSKAVAIETGESEAQAFRGLLGEQIKNDFSSLIEGIKKGLTPEGLAKAKDISISAAKFIIDDATEYITNPAEYTAKNPGYSLMNIPLTIAGLGAGIKGVKALNRTKRLRQTKKLTGVDKYKALKEIAEELKTLRKPPVMEVGIKRLKGKQPIISQETIPVKLSRNPIIQRMQTALLSPKENVFSNLYKKVTVGSAESFLSKQLREGQGKFIKLRNETSERTLRLINKLDDTEKKMFVDYVEGRLAIKKEHFTPRFKMAVNIYKKVIAEQTKKFIKSKFLDPTIADERKWLMYKKTLSKDKPYSILNIKKIYKKERAEALKKGLVKIEEPIYFPHTFKKKQLQFVSNTGIETLDKMKKEGWNKDLIQKFINDPSSISEPNFNAIAAAMVKNTKIDQIKGLFMGEFFEGATKKRKFAHFKQAKGVEGYIKDLEKVIPTYLTRVKSFERTNEIVDDIVKKYGRKEQTIGYVEWYPGGTKEYFKNEFDIGKLSKRTLKDIDADEVARGIEEMVSGKLFETVESIGKKDFLPFSVYDFKAAPKINPGVYYAKPKAIKDRPVGMTSKRVQKELDSISFKAVGESLAPAVRQSLGGFKEVVFHKEILNVGKKNLVYIPKSIYNLIHSRMKATAYVTKLFDKIVTDPWRKVTLLGRLSWILYNHVGNEVFKTIGGIAPISTMQRINKKAMKRIAKKHAGGMSMAKEMSMEQHWGVHSEAKLAKAYDVIARGWKKIGAKKIENFVWGIEEAVENHARISGMIQYSKIIAKRDLKRLGKKGKEVFKKMDDLDKIKYIDKNPHLAKEAVDKVNEFLNDYTHMYHWQRKYARRVFPFISFTLHILRLSAKLPFKYPGRTKMLQYVAEIGKEYGMDYELQPDLLGKDLSELPQYATDAGSRRILDSKYYFSSAYMNPFGMIIQVMKAILTGEGWGEVVNNAGLGLPSNPLWATIIESFTGIDLFTKRKFEKANRAARHKLIEKEKQEQKYDEFGLPIDTPITRKKVIDAPENQAPPFLDLLARKYWPYKVGMKLRRKHFVMSGEPMWSREYEGLEGSFVKDKNKWLPLLRAQAVGAGLYEFDPNAKAKRIKRAAGAYKQIIKKQAISEVLQKKKKQPEYDEFGLPIE